MPGADLMAGRAVPAAAVRAEQRGGERARGHRPASARRAGEQPGVRHPGVGLAAQHARPRPTPPRNSGHDRVLAGQVAEDRCTGAGRRQSFDDRREAAGDVLGRGRHRIGQQVAEPVLDLARSVRPAAWVASSTRYRSGSACAWARKPCPDPLVELARLGLEPVRGPGPPAEARRRAAGRAGWSGRAPGRRSPTC